MGATNQQIAQQLDISINTVKVHLRNIFGKIGVASRTEATVYAIRQGLVEVDGRPEPLAPPFAVADSPPEAVEDVVATPVQEAAPAAVGLAEGAAPALAEPLPAPPAKPRARRAPVVVTLAAAAALGIAGGAYLWQAQRQDPPAVSTPAPVGAQVERWSTRLPLPRARSDFALAPFDGRLYVIGGGASEAASSAVDRYDPANDLWVELTDKPTASRYVQAVSIGRQIFVPGGEASDGRVLDVLEAYDPRSQEWEALPPLPAPRSRYALASLEGRLYLFGGWDGSRYCDEVFVYDPAARAWSDEGQRLPTPRRDASAAVVEGRIYVVGGEGERGALRANEVYDPAGDSGRRWESAAPLTDVVADPAAVGILDQAYVFDPAQRLALQYTPRTDSWAAVAAPADASLSSRATFLGTSVFVFGAAEDGTPMSEYRAIFNTFLPGTTGSDR
ncbi:MAG: hypothetical protein RLZZ387_5185 [Chloroflexota bacterium]